MNENEDVKLHEALHFGSDCKNVLVTGGTGFIGQLLVRALLADGKRVTLLSRDPKRAAWLFDGKLCSIKTMDELPADYPLDTIINLAGARILGWRWSAARQAALRRSRIDLTNSIVKWIARAESTPRLLLSASAIGYYGIQKHGDQTILDESAPPQEIFMSQLCQDWEHAALAASAYGVNVCCMRFGLVLGQQGALPMMLLPIKLGFGGRMGSGEQWQSWIHVQDLLRGIAHLTQISANGQLKFAAEMQAQAFNFTAPESLSQKQFCETAAKILHRPCIFPTPAFAIRLMLGEQADLLLEGQRVAPEKLLAHGFQFRFARLDDALRDLI